MDRFPGDDPRTQLIDAALAAHEAVDADPVTEVTAIVDALLAAPEALLMALDGREVHTVYRSIRVTAGEGRCLWSLPEVAA